VNTERVEDGRKRRERAQVVRAQQELVAVAARVHIVPHDGIDANARQQARKVRHAPQVRARERVRDARASIAPLDAAVEVVPQIQHSKRRAWRRRIDKARGREQRRGLALHKVEEAERAIERAVRRARGDGGRAVGKGRQRKALERRARWPHGRKRRGRARQLHVKNAAAASAATAGAAAANQRADGAQVAAEHCAEAALELVARARQRAVSAAAAVAAVDLRPSEARREGRAHGQVREPQLRVGGRRRRRHRRRRRERQ
jgi:hypothetical protein